MIATGVITGESECGAFDGGSELCCNTQMSDAVRPLETDADVTVKMGGMLLTSVTRP